MQKNLYFSCTNAFFSLSLHPILLNNPNNLNFICMEDLKNAVQQEAEKQLKEAQQKAEEQQAAAKKMMEEQTQNVGKAVVKGMALSAVMLVGRKIISFFLGKMGKVGLIAVAIVLCTTAYSDNSNDPDNNTTPTQTGSTINPADYFGMWRIDSVKVNGVLQGPPHKVIDIISASQLVFDGNDTRSYSIVGDIITIEDATGISFKVIDSSPAVPHLLAVFADQTPSQDLYLARIPDVQGTPVALSEAAILGT